jgi:hypothetical protein
VSAAPKARILGNGSAMPATTSDSVAYRLSPAGRRWKSAVQTFVISCTRMSSRPKLTSSELNSDMRNLSNAQCVATPTAKKAGVVITSATSGSRLVELASSNVT